MHKEFEAKAANPMTEAKVTDRGNVLEISFFNEQSRRVVLYVRENATALVIEENGDILTGATFGKSAFDYLAKYLRENKKIIDESNSGCKVRDGGKHETDSREENQGVY